MANTIDFKIALTLILEFGEEKKEENLLKQKGETINSNDIQR